MRLFISVPLMLWIWSSSGSRTKRDIVCQDGTGYMHHNNELCCLNCPAGTFVKEECSKAFERGVCQQCDFDTYTEHDNGLIRCLKCTKCRPDQELVEQCSSTRNTHCQCKAGSFCLPDQACEICKTCTKCKEDEKMVENCTANSNTICQKRGPISPRTWQGAVISAVAFIMVILIFLCFLYWKTMPADKKAVASKWLRGIWKTDTANDSNLAGTKQNCVNISILEKGGPFQPLISLPQSVGDDLEDEEDKGLGPSLPNTTASSQTSLPVYAPASADTSEYCLSRLLPPQPNARENETPCRLVPLNDDSLRKSFDLFGEIDMNYHNRFFRSLGLSDNIIKTTEMNYPSPEDRVYELLKVWMEKEGMKADFNSLIEALRHLNQRLSAESIITRAIESGYFKYEED